MSRTHGLTAVFGQSLVIGGLSPGPGSRPWLCATRPVSADSGPLRWRSGPVSLAPAMRLLFPEAFRRRFFSITNVGCYFLKRESRGYSLILANYRSRRGTPGRYPVPKSTAVQISPPISDRALQ